MPPSQSSSRPSQVASEAAGAPGRQESVSLPPTQAVVPVEAVVPASSKINLDRLLELASGRDVRVADEDELQRLFPACEVGAMPPFGPLYGQTVYVDAMLALEPEIVFNAGTHREAIAMRWNDFVKMVNPIVGRFAESSDDRVIQYRLSYRA